MASFLTGTLRSVLSITTVAALALASANTLADHYRGGTSFFTNNGSNTVEITSRTYWQATSILDNINLNSGDMVFTIDNVLGAIDVPVNRIFFNDPNVFVTSSGEGVVTGVFADENILLVEQKVTHTYSTAGTFSVGVVRGAYYQDEVLNTEPASPSDLQMTQTIVLDGSGNDSAVIDNFSPIVDLAVGGNQAFQLSATDPDGDDVTWSFAPLFESGVNSLAAIGGNTIELNSSGLLSWDTTGGTVGSLYAVEAIAADSHGNRTSADFIVRLCDASTAGCNASSVPEPAPLALLGFGLVGLIISRRRPWLRRN